MLYSVFRDYPLYKSDPCCILFLGTTRCTSQTHVVFCFGGVPAVQVRPMLYSVFRDYPLYKSEPCCILFLRTTFCANQTYVVFFLVQEADLFGLLFLSPGNRPMLCVEFSATTCYSSQPILCSVSRD